MRLAAILTSYNRRAKTLECLASLERQQCDRETHVEIFLTDDASSDGTGAAVRSGFPEVILLRGTGQLFWCGGMRLAFGEALRQDFDAYLWLNDDTILSPGALDQMLRTLSTLRSRGERKTIVVGATCDPTSRAWTYGGVVHSSRYHPLKFRPVEPTDVPRSCDTFNGNCVLIPREVANVIGNISEGFTQGMGDFDYGLRARSSRCSIWLAPGFVGTCSRNVAEGSWEDTSLSLRKRWKHVCSPKGLQPREYLRYAARHAGPFWPLYWVMPYLRLLISGLLPANTATRSERSGFARSSDAR